MPFLLRTQAPPIREDAAGALRVGESRVLLELVLQAHQDGATPEVIVRQYPSLELADVYSVIGYYLQHRAELDEYLERREQLGQEVRARIEAAQRDGAELRQRLLARRP